MGIASNARFLFVLTLGLSPRFTLVIFIRFQGLSVIFITDSRGSFEGKLSLRLIVGAVLTSPVIVLRFNELELRALKKL